MSVYEVLLDTGSQIYFVQVGTRPGLDRRITIAVGNNMIAFLTRNMVSRDKRSPYVYDWRVNGSLTPLHSLLSSPYNSEKEALDAVLILGYKVYIFDTIEEMAQFIVKLNK